MIVAFLGRVEFLRRGVFAFVAVVAVTSATAQDFITLTKGGGVTGNTTVFRISRSGEVAKSTGGIEPEFSQFAKLRRAKTRKYFRKTHALVTEEAFNHPGNMYTAISLMEGDKVEKLVWGDKTHKTPVKAEKLYKKIEASLSRLTFSANLRK